MITILRHCVASNIWVATLKVKVMTLQQKRVQPITLFEVVFYNFLIEMITILR